MGESITLQTKGVSTRDVNPELITEQTGQSCVPQPEDYYNDELQMCVIPQVDPCGSDKLFNEPVASQIPQAYQPAGPVSSSTPNPKSQDVKVMTVNAWAYDVPGFKGKFFKTENTAERMNKLAD